MHAWLPSDPQVDLALLEIPANGHAAAVFSNEEPRPGEMVFAFGHPWGQRNVLTGGVLSAVTRLRGRHGEVPILRADVQLAPGNSGGPLLNTAGEVIGLNAMIFGGDQSVAIPASVHPEFLETARKTCRQARRGGGDLIRVAILAPALALRIGLREVLRSLPDVEVAAEAGQPAGPACRSMCW